MCVYTERRAQSLRAKWRICFEILSEGIVRLAGDHIL